MTKSAKKERSNFESHKVVSPPKSGVRVIRLRLSVGGREKLSSKSSGIPTSKKTDKSPEFEDKHSCAV